MRTLKLTIAYDGTRFVGWQRQAQGTSIQGLLEEALARFEGAPVVVHGAGRTDAGVHALGQVASAEVSCRHDVATLLRGFNAQLPDDVRLLRVEDAPAGFHARFNARSKTYRYVMRAATTGNPFDRAYVWHLPDSLNLAAMRQSARALVGTHDFAAFKSMGNDVGSTVRTMIRSEVLVGRTVSGPPVEPGPPSGGFGTPGMPRPVGDQTLISYEIAGDGFLRHMVRAIVGTLVDVGRGRRRPDVIADLLAGGARADAGATAPPHGLFLVGVVYD